MNEEFVNYNQALKLKALGFNEPCFGYYDTDGLQVSTHYWYPENKNTSFPESQTTNNPKISAPTFSQAFRWFREKGYDVKVIKESPGLYFGFYWNGAAWIMVGNGTYEASELACLDKLIEIVEQTERIEHGIYQ